MRNPLDLFRSLSYIQSFPPLTWLFLLSLSMSQSYWQRTRLWKPELTYILIGVTLEGNSPGWCLKNDSLFLTLSLHFPLQPHVPLYPQSRPSLSPITREKSAQLDHRMVLSHNMQWENRGYFFPFQKTASHKKSMVQHVRLDMKWPSLGP